MEQIILSNAQLEQYSSEFVDEFCGNDSETSKIIAGLTAIVNDNEADLEKMKNQKWFQRIGKTITGQNKATVEAMKERREDLAKFTVKAIDKLYNMNLNNNQMSAFLSYALSINCEHMVNLEDSVKQLAYKLNDKINSVEKCNDIITDIQNGIFNPSKPLLSLIEIMEQVDERTANNPSKMDRIKQTMVSSGFNFDEHINLQSFANDVFKMPEEKVGSLYLFCQKHSENYFLKFACRLIENYFYQPKINRAVALSNGSAIKNAMSCCGLISEIECSLDDMYSDFKDILPQTNRTLILQNTEAHEEHDNRNDELHISDESQRDFINALYHLAIKGDAWAQLEFGKRIGYEILLDWHESEKWLLASAKQGNEEAIFRIGRLYYDHISQYDDNAKENTQNAIKWLSIAARQTSNQAEAKYLLGACYFYGPDEVKDEKKAVEWFRQAALDGYATAQYRLAYCLMNGKGVEKNCEEAIHWYEKAAIQGENEAFLEIGDYYRYQQIYEAIKWFELAALSEDRATRLTAKQYLCDLYSRDLEIPCDNEKALKWCKALIDDGEEYVKDRIKELLSR